MLAAPSNEIADPAAPRGRSFLDLPLELRQMIYRLCLTRDADNRDPSKTHQTITDVIAPSTWTIVTPRFRNSKPHSSITVPQVLHQVPFSIFKNVLTHRQNSYELAVQLLCVNRQVHDEAARVLYGDNKFTFQVWFYGRNRDPEVLHGIRYPQDFPFAHNFLRIAPNYLRMVRRCDLQVWLPVKTLNLYRPTYLRVFDRVSLLAETLCIGHSLQSLTVTLKRFVREDCFARDISFFQNVLEPLGTVAGIRDVRIMNVTPEFEVKLTMAMKGSEIACTLAEEPFVTKMVKTRGRRRPRRIRSKKYYESRYDWKEDAPVPLESWMSSIPRS